MPTAQAIFDTVWTHLETQPRRAVEGSACQYRTYAPIEGEEVELRCAIGCLLPDTETDEVFAFQGGVQSLLEEFPRLNVHVWPYDMDENEWEEMDACDSSVPDAFLLRLQNAHDERGNWGVDGFVKWGVMTEIAERYGLETPS